MSEQGFQFFAKVYPITEELLYAGCLALFFRPFLQERGRWWRLLLLIAADLLAFLLCSSVTVPQGTFTGSNPFYGSVDGQFIAPKEIKALGSVPLGSKAVVIHPKVQERMEQDPAYAQEIYAKIDTWFAFDVARNEAHMPGCTVGMSQAVAIGEDGNICNACSSSGGRISYSESGNSGDEWSWWDLRMARHAEFMKLLVENQLQRQIQASELLSATAAKARLADMLKNGNLLEIFGDEISGVPTETVLAMTQTQIWGGGAIL